MSGRQHDRQLHTAKERAVLLDRYRNEIMRESGNRDSLAQVKARILGDANVRSDLELAGALRAQIAEREAAWNRHAPTPRQAMTQAPAEMPRLASSSVEAQRLYHDLVVEFDRAVTHGDEATARPLLDHIRMMAGENPRLIGPEMLEHLTKSAAGLATRRQDLDNMIKSLSEEAEAAAAAGDDVETARILQRLSGIHATYPASLPEGGMKSIGERIMRASNRYEHRLAARQLVRREREVAAEIQQLASAVHRFHIASRTLSHKGDAYRQAEAEYRRLVSLVQSHNAD